MVSRTLLALFAVAFVAALASAAPVEETNFDVDNYDGDEDSERGIKDWLTEQVKEAGKKLAKEAIEFFKKEAKKVNLDCVKEVYDNCKINPIKHPKKYYKCAKNYVVEHKEHCYHDDDHVEEQVEEHGEDKAEEQVA